MIITPTEKIDVEIIPEILQMPIYCLEQKDSKHKSKAKTKQVGSKEQGVLAEKAVVANWVRIQTKSSQQKSTIVKDVERN